MGGPPLGGLEHLGAERRLRGLRAAGAACGLARPATIACHYLAVGRFDPVELEVDLLRATRRTAAVRVHMRQDGTPLAEATVWAVAEGLAGYEWHEAEPPDAPAPGDTPTVEDRLGDQPTAQRSPFSFAAEPAAEARPMALGGGVGGVPGRAPRGPRLDRHRGGRVDGAGHARRLGRGPAPLPPSTCGGAGLMARTGGGAVDVPRGSPSAHGVDPAGITALIDALEGDEQLEPHGLIVQRHGVRVVEAAWAPHRIDRSRLIYSLSKTFTGTALALQLGEGRLSLDDLVSDHLPELFEAVDERTRRLRVRHVASMSTGHDRETFYEAITLDPDDPVRGFLRIPPDHEPGTAFAYNQPPVLALATILQRLAGQRLADYLRPRLLDPLGIGDLRWVQLRPGLDMGFSGVYTSLDAVARLGQLHLDGGAWQGRQLLPADWVPQASTPQVANPGEPDPDWQQGYGFQLWMSRHGYRGDGAFGQYMLVLPEHDAAVSIFSGNEDMQALLDHVWAHLLPALRPDPVRGDDGEEELAARIATLRVRTPSDRVGGGVPERTSATFAPGAGSERSHRSITSLAVAGDELVVHEGDASFAVPLGTAWAEGPTGHAAASAARSGDGRLRVDLAFLHSPHRLELLLDPAAGTFTAEWPAVPLFGAGLAYRLSEIRPPG